MTNCNKLKNPLQQNGTSQAQRLLPGMDKNKFARVDEKDFADWILFANEFSAFINYYSPVNAVAGNWQFFFSNDISSQVGMVAIQDIEKYRIEIKERIDYIKDENNKSSLNNVRNKLNELFSALLTLSKALDETFIKLPAEAGLKNAIQDVIQTKLSPALKRLIAYCKAAETRSYINHSALGEWEILNKQLTDWKDIITSEDLGADWLFDTDKDNWQDYAGTISADDSIFNNSLTAFADDYLSISHAVYHNLFSGIFDTYLTAYTKIIRDAEAELLKTLEGYDSHTPHYALFLTFLKLFKYNQAHINTITQRHLDFYYKEVLKLQPKPAEGNKVHVLAELARQEDDWLLPKSTALKAGKDSQGKEVIYSLNADTVFNKAKVAQLKTFYIGSSDDSINDKGVLSQDNNGRAFASPVTNSEDGVGAELTSPFKEWPPFVHKVYEEAQLVKIAMPKAQLGFALASHYLYLTEGERKVYIRFVTVPASILDGKTIECWLTTEKGWYKVVNPVYSPPGTTLSDKTTVCTEISFTIPGSAPAIVNYNAAVHGDTYGCALPVLKIYLVHDDIDGYPYESLKDTTISKIEIRVEVGMDSVYNQKGLKNLLLSNDFGALDASKPFMPFGSQPRKDAGFVVGHKEIFSKKNASVKLNIEWADLPALESSIQYETNSLGTGKPSVSLQFEEVGIWKSNADDNSIASSVSLFNGLNAKVQLLSSEQKIPEKAICDYQNDYTVHNQSSVNGFIKLCLDSSFGNSQYIKDFSLFLIEKNLTTGKTITTAPVEPYTPLIKSLYASYSANCIDNVASASEFGTRDIFFFHNFPFGEGEQHKYLQPDTDVYLLPQFTHPIEGGAEPHIGEFYIGIEKINPGEAVNILFQLMEGTTDPNVVKPPDHINWSYLSNNRWMSFLTSQYSDNTLALVQSGIISFTIPKDATLDHTILPAGYIWIRAAINKAPEAVCKLISADAQAGLATFSNNNNADDYLNSPLPAATISKLKFPDAAIKKINQPYPSSGGRPKENENHFYIRISERLRHKERAITVWDYEHLVLEAFPEIYKVKCLNHTQIEDGIYNEVKPGHVSIITIPSLQNRNETDPLKPYTQQSTLTKIEDFLSRLTSCFVILHVRQPQFEEIRLEFALKLYEQYKDFTFYENQLKKEITQFLSPWAFDGSSTIDFGGKVYKSVLINFIEERYYVDYITDVKMFVTVADIESADMDEISGSTGRSILVSVPESKHSIIPIKEKVTTTVETCIEN